MSERLEEIAFTGTDIQRLWRAQRVRFLYLGLCVAFLSLLYFARKAPVYEVDATFWHPSVVHQGSGLAKLLDGLLPLQGEDEIHIRSLLSSKRLLRSAAERFGLQVCVQRSGVLQRIGRRVRDNFRAEFGKVLAAPRPFRFRDVRYDGQRTLALRLQFVDPEQFVLLDAKGTTVAQGRLGESVEGKGFRFCLEEKSKGTEVGVSYPLTVHPWQTATKELLRCLSVKPSPVDGQVMHLTLTHHDRTMAQQCLTDLIGRCQAFYKRENEAKGRVQLAHLEKRRAELEQQFGLALNEQMEFLQKSFREGMLSDGEDATPPHGKQQAATRYDRDLSGQENMSLYAQLRSLLLQNQLQQKQMELPAQVSPEEGLGVTLEMSQELYSGYNEQLEQLHVHLQELMYLKEQLQRPEFELSHAGSTLTDFTSQELIRRACDISLQLRDEKNRSPKEQAQLKEAMGIQKRFFADHLDKMIEISRLQEHFLEGKKQALSAQCAQLLSREGHFLQAKMGELQAQMRNWPEHMRTELHLKLKREIIASMVAEVAKAAEAKKLGLCLHGVEGKPLDPAISALAPRPPFLLLSTAVTTLFMTGGIFLLYVLRTVFKGFPPSEGTLEALGFATAGELHMRSISTLGEMGDDTLRSLREIVRFCASQQELQSVVALLGGGEIDISAPLAELFHMQGKRVLLVQCRAPSLVPSSHQPGLWHYLTGEVETCPVRSGERFDFLPCGGSSRHMPEMLGHPRFTSLIATFAAQYDIVLLQASGRVDIAQDTPLLKLATKGVVLYSSEPIGTLRAFQTCRQVIFVHVDSEGQARGRGC